MLWKEKKDVIRFFQPRDNNPLLKVNVHETDEERELMDRLFNPKDVDDFERHIH